ncbi:hypothetical protein WH87_05005 [Devosia epidermidihirudinis]|uniref:Uncharacterized protein n=1 Tax=Devosia epidermidihirudinis TaxID=1293439 RepID=A0A0F5QFP7_9HYPH|nr:hypothetical protein [Devosia epidermidihirudinis]KKC39551.1 hypothetical protein WH87_05005 [Devosia epidermidihirudinis]
MTKAALDAKAALVTQIQTVLRAARDDRNGAKLREGNVLMLSDAFMRLPLESQADLQALYREAFRAVSGAFA